MIDNFALAVSHGLLILVAWRLIWRPDLEDDGAPSTPQRPAWRSRSSEEDAAGA